MIQLLKMNAILENIKNNLSNYHILNSNFRERYNEIEENIKSAVVISIDSEFSGLSFASKFKNSLFHRGPDRYEVIKKNVDNFLIIEFGLTTFHFNRDENKYEAHMYNFFIFPRPIASVDTKFACQASSLQFLSKCSFDFNKFVYEGIPYLNEEQERVLRSELVEGKLFQQVERNVAFDDEKDIQRVISDVSVWASKAVVGEEYILENDNFRENVIVVYMIHKEIRNRYKDLWSTSSLNNIIVRKVVAGEREELISINGNYLERDILDYFLGFTKIFRLLVSSKKPIVGHNLFIDLMILYNQFYEPLPDNYSVFKKKINTLFPKIYDTKYISYELRKVLKKEDAWESNMLLDLYNYFAEGRGRESNLYRPDVKLWKQSVDQYPDILVHEAGWDSYICGYCFLQLGHYFASATYGLDAYRRPLTSTEHINSVAKFANKVNVVRASIGYVNFAGDDPPSNRPQILLVKVKGNCSISSLEVAEMLAKYCSVDTKPLNNKSVLVAVSNFSCARQILRDFLKHEKYRVSLYHPFRDSTIIRGVLWSGLLISGGLCIGAFIQKLLK
ncbi:pre-piRNA 3'-exonuclease trimmer-like isoform X2 [Lycorma delicatula]|uniref:pre-piRNA 3'-exonuclease trimmer-like isoform X2 n=1 Tax=Lycorma delicatula TaxID=130591 RepID=UPI003F516BD8